MPAVNHFIKYVNKTQLINILKIPKKQTQSMSDLAKLLTDLLTSQNHHSTETGNSKISSTPSAELFNSIVPFSLRVRSRMVFIPFPDFRVSA